MLLRRTSQPSASPIRVANSTTFRLSEGSTPGSARQTGQVWAFGSPPKAVEQPQKILLRVRSWACTSSPITTSKSETPISVLQSRGGWQRPDLTLERARGAQEHRLVEGPADELQAHRHPLRRVQAAGQRDPGQRRQVAGHGEDVGEVHGERVGHLLAEPERDRGRHRSRDDVAVLEGALEVPPEQGADLLRPQVISVVVAGGERIGAEHDAALRLRAEAGLARRPVQLLEGA